MTVRERVVGAPISWGVCEAPGWGLALPPERVLGEMRTLGLTSTELGPTGYLGDSPTEVSDRLERFGLRLVGGFLPVPMHIDPELDLTDATAAMDVLAEAGSDVVVLAAQSADGSYEQPVTMTDEQWPVLLRTLDRLQDAARQRGLRPSLHPHVGTAIERRADVYRLLEECDVALCLDTGHLLIGGTDPVELATAAAGRVSHVHLKDVNATIAARVTSGEISYMHAVQQGLYTPLGVGDVDVAACVQALERSGYDGYYVLEQDCALADVPADDAGPIDDVRASLAFLDRLGA